MSRRGHAGGLEPLRRERPARRRGELRHLGQRRGCDLRARLPGEEPHIPNDFDEVGTSNIQAVALMTQNDKMIFENVRVLGNQDSLYVKTGNVDTVQRTYFKNCYVEGDTDFIFGRATFVLDNCEISTWARAGAPPQATTSLHPAPTSATPTVC